GMHPELEAEMQFGLENSAVDEVGTLVERLEEFLEQGADWSEAEKEIVARREEATKRLDPLAQGLRAVVASEVRCVYELWRGDGPSALLHAQEVCDGLAGGREFRPYQAWWYYLAGGVACLAAETDQNLDRVMADLFRRAAATTFAVSWFARLAHLGVARAQGAA